MDETEEKKPPKGKRRLIFSKVAVIITPIESTGGALGAKIRGDSGLSLKEIRGSAPRKKDFERRVRNLKTTVASAAQETATANTSKRCFS